MGVTRRVLDLKAHHQAEFIRVLQSLSLAPLMEPHPDKVMPPPPASPQVLDLKAGLVTKQSVLFQIA